MVQRTDVPELRRAAGGLLDAMAEHGGPVSLPELLEWRPLAGAPARLQLSIARVSGLIRAVPGETERYIPTALGLVFAGRTHGA